VALTAPDPTDSLAPDPMSKNILIVESDAVASQSMRAELEDRGFTVQETSDGKGSVELIRRTRPDLVVMAEKLAAGQNGYILCGKLKKDDDLKAIPVVIVGAPENFAAHRKLKTRAEDYVARPLDVSALSDAVGNLVGFPEVAASDQGVDDSLSLSDLVDDNGPPTGEYAAEEIAVDAEVESTLGGDPELDMLDAAFDDATGPEEDVPLEESTGEINTEGVGDAFAALDGLDGDGSEDRTMVGFVAPADVSSDAPAPPRTFSSPAHPAAAAAAQADAGELRGLRTRVGELERAVQEAHERATRADDRVRELEEQLSSTSADLEAVRASGSSGSSKEVFALKEAANRKEKEILRLRSELNEKDNEIVELKDKSLQLEQQLSEASGEMARKDAQLKTLTQKADQLQSERRRFDKELLQAKEEARTASASLSTLQGELEETRAQLGSAQEELEALRNRTGDLESELRSARDEAQELRTELSGQRDAAEQARREADGVRSELDQAQIDLDSAKNQVTTQATAFAEEAASLRRRISELEEAAQKNEDRLTKFYAKIKEDEKVREKTRKALAIALQLVDEQQQVPVDVDVDVDDAAEA
jgi:CheY-like chemotaxis protein